MMQLLVTINDVQLMALVNSDSTHNFIAAELVDQVGLKRRSVLRDTYLHRQ